MRMTLLSEASLSTLRLPDKVHRRLVLEVAISYSKLAFSWTVAVAVHCECG